jgi:peptidoglycan hydrolase CwlO-like protein
VTAARVLPFVNVAGCLLLAGFIVLQWRGGQVLSQELQESRSREIHEKNARLDAEKMSRQLQADIDGLKASIDSIQQAAAEAEEKMVAKEEEAKGLAGLVTKAQDQIKTWEEAVKARDEAIVQRDARLKELNEALVATRARLDEAVAELKKAGAR